MNEALEAAQGQPEGETVTDPGTITAPGQSDVQHNPDHIEGNAGDNLEGEADGQEITGQADGGGDQEPEKPKPGEKKKLPWELRRIHEETNKRRDAERRTAELEAELARVRNGGSSEPEPSQTVDLDTLADRKAREIVAQQQFSARVNAWDQAGAEEFGRQEFNDKCNLIASLVDDRQQAALMQTLTDPDIVEDGHKVIVALADDPEEAERILSLPPVKQALALSKLSAKLAKPEAPAPKPISKAPAPVTPIGGSARAPTRLEDPDLPMDKFADEFLKSINKRGH